MAEVKIYVLQTPRILEDGASVILPYKKAEAVLYYLAVEKTANREQLAALLWDNCDETTAKKNMRHALYTIRKNFHMELIISPDRQTLRLNPEINFYIDYDQLTENKNIRVYEAEFMSGFYVKNAYHYEEWLTWKRNFIRDKYLKILEEELKNTEKLSVEEGEGLFEKYVKEDPLEEQVYFYMLQIYGRNKLYYKGIRVYQKLAALMNTELKVVPKREIRELYEKFLEAWNQEARNSHNTEDQDGHTEIMQELLEVYRDFLAGYPEVVLLSGESGVGKTYLADQLLQTAEKEGSMVLRAVCLETEQDMKLQPWNVMMMAMAEAITQNRIEIDDKYLQAADTLFPFFRSCYLKESLLLDSTLPYSYRAMRNLFLNFLVQSAEQMPMILFFDNIQYMDDLSLELLSLLIRTRNGRIMILLSCPDVFPERLRKYMTPLLKEKYIERMLIMPFTQEETASIAGRKLGNEVVTSEFVDWIYEECQGNAFFLEVLLSEYANGNCRRGESGHLNQLLKEQLEAFSKDTRQVLELIACCQAWADLDSLECILKKDSLVLIQELDELKEKGLICEKLKAGQVRFMFCTERMKKFVHSQMPPSKVRIFHRRLAQYIEELPSYDASRATRLIYHYTICGNKEKTLYYKIYSLAEYAYKYYELYPIYSNSFNRKAYENTSMVEYCDELEKEIKRLYQKGNKSWELNRLYILLLQTKAQYCIPQGYYEEGIRCVEKAMKANAVSGNDLLTNIQCLRFLIYQQLNVWQIDKTKRYFEESFQAAERGGYQEDYAVTCRLYGLYLSMTGDFRESMEYLQKALDFFEGHPLQSPTYALNISACYNYMGEVLRKTRRFEEALEYYEKAALVCEENHYHCSAIVYSNMGRTYRMLGKRKESELAFYKSDEMYEESFTLIGRSMTKAYLALLEAEKGEAEKARKRLREARESGQQLASPYTMGILYVVEAELAKRFPGMFKGMLEETAEEYWKKAVQCLGEIPGAYEAE